MGAKNVKEQLNVALEMIESHVVSERREQVDKVMNEFGSRLILCPASGKKSYHGAYRGGLLVHTVRVTQLMFSVCKGLEISEEEISNESKVIVGLFHDLGKIGNFDGIPQYVDEESNWHRKKLGRYFVYNEELQDGITVPQRSIRLLTKAGLEITDSEYQAILFHDGLYPPENRVNNVMYSKDKLMRVAHMADSWASLMEDI